MNKLVQITFEHSYSEFPMVTEGPYEWIEMIGGNMFGMVPGAKEADEIAGVNLNGTWDAGPCELDETGNRKRREYTRWTISVVELTAEEIDELDNLLLNLSGGLLPKDLSKNEVALLHKRYGANWFKVLEYTEPQYEKPVW